MCTALGGIRGLCVLVPESVRAQTSACGTCRLRSQQIRGSRRDILGVTSPDGPSGTRRRKEKLVLYSILKCPFIPEVLSFFFFFWPIFYYEKNFKHAWKLKQFDTKHPVFSIARSSHEQFTVVVPHLTVGASSLPSQVLRPPDSDLGREGSPLITAGSPFFSSLG